MEGPQENRRKSGGKPEENRRKTGGRSNEGQKSEENRRKTGGKPEENRRKTGGESEENRRRPGGEPEGNRKPTQDRFVPKAKQKREDGHKWSKKAPAAAYSEERWHFGLLRLKTAKLPAL